MLHGRQFCDLQYIKIKHKTYILWNNARYRPTDAIDSTRLQRWICSVANCNAAIYVLNEALVDVKRHDEFGGQKHSHSHHRTWKEGSIIEHNGIQAMQRETSNNCL